MTKTGAQVLDEAVTEKEFQWQVRQAAIVLGWMAYAAYDSRRSAEGYPDLTMRLSHRWGSF